MYQNFRKNPTHGGAKPKISNIILLVVVIKSLVMPSLVRVPVSIFKLNKDRKNHVDYQNFKNF